MEIMLPALAVLALDLLFCYVIAKQFEEIPFEKGYINEKYFWITFLLMPLGIAMVIALPDKYARPKETVQVVEKTIEKTNEKTFDNDELPEL